MQHAEPIASADVITDQNFHRIAKAIVWLGEHYREQPVLKELADVAGLSEYHFQRLFTRWAGISPKRFSQFLTAGYAQQQLRAAMPALDVAYDAGLSSPSRLHNLFVSLVAMTPAEYRDHGAGLAIRYGRASSAFGDCLIASTERGLCHLGFVDPHAPSQQFNKLTTEFANADLSQDDDWAQETVGQLFTPLTTSEPGQFTLHVRGTNFQLQTWQALLATQPGDLISYQQLSGRMDSNAVRAAASAVGANPVAWLIPCHRVIRATGAVGQYRWGSARKTAIIGWEAAYRERTTSPAN